MCQCFTLKSIKVLLSSQRWEGYQERQPKIFRWISMVRDQSKSWSMSTGTVLISTSLRSCLFPISQCWLCIPFGPILLCKNQRSGQLSTVMFCWISYSLCRCISCFSNSFNSCRSPSHSCLKVGHISRQSPCSWFCIIPPSGRQSTKKWFSGKDKPFAASACGCDCCTLCDQLSNSRTSSECWCKLCGRSRSSWSFLSLQCLGSRTPSTPCRLQPHIWTFT